MEEFRKSINSILYQRVTSPLYGTFFTTWLIWNWRIWYVTIFISEDRLVTDKLTFLQNNFSDPLKLIVYPLISTALVLTLFSYVSNGSYWLDLKFKGWRIKTRNDLEQKQLLTLEQSIELRNEIREQEQNFDKLLQRKNEEIIALKTQIDALSEEIRNESKVLEPVTLPLESSKEDKATSKKASNVGASFSLSDYDKLEKKKNVFIVFGDVFRSVRDRKSFPTGFDADVKEYFIVNEIVNRSTDGR